MHFYRFLIYYLLYVYVFIAIQIYYYDILKVTLFQNTLKKSSL